MITKPSTKKKPVKKHQTQQSEFLRAIDRRYPGTADKIRQAIEKARESLPAVNLKIVFSGNIAFMSPI